MFALAFSIGAIAESFDGHAADLFLLVHPIEAVYHTPLALSGMWGHPIARWRLDAVDIGRAIRS